MKRREVERGAVSVTRTSNGLGCRGLRMTCVDCACVWAELQVAYSCEGLNGRQQRAERKRRDERRREDKSILGALQAAPRFYEGLPACPPATASTHPTPAIPPAPPLPGREQARPRGQLAFLSLAAARAPQCTANHGAMTRRGWARGASVGASGGGHGVAVVAGVGLGCQDG
jgi:hypothetical protein